MQFFFNFQLTVLEDSSVLVPKNINVTPASYAETWILVSWQFKMHWLLNMTGPKPGASKSVSLCFTKQFAGYLNNQVIFWAHTISFLKEAENFGVMVTTDVKFKCHIDKSGLQGIICSETTPIQKLPTRSNELLRWIQAYNRSGLSHCTSLICCTVIVIITVLKYK